MSTRDKRLCLLILVLFFAPHFVVGWMDSRAEKKLVIAEVIAAQHYTMQPMEDPDEDAKITAALLERGYFRDDVPLTYELQDITQTACEEFGVPYSLALAVMEQESGFRTDAENPSGCYGLMQLNPDFFPSGLSPAENIRSGVSYLGELLDTYEDIEQAVTAYFYGPSDRTSSWYSDEVLGRVEKWK